MSYGDLKLTDNKVLNRFELQVDDSIAFVEYKLSGSLLFLLHTEVPPAIEGKGVASAIVEKVLQHAKDNNYKIVPRCSYVQGFLEKHKEWAYIVSPKPQKKS